MSTLADDLTRRFGADTVIDPTGRAAARYLADATQARGMSGTAEAIVRPATSEQVAELLAYAYDHDVPITPRGGGTGYSGGAVPDGGLLLATERLTGIPRIDLERWRVDTPVGVTTWDLAERVRQSGLLFPPDPGSQEVSLIGGNIATNAGGPHTFKYGQTGHWVETLTVALAPGELVTLGAPVRKDVSSLDLRSLLVGSEGTLGIVCAAGLRLIPLPEARLPILARYRDTAAGVAAIHAVLVSGVRPAALEYLDAHAATDGHFTVIAEVDGPAEAAAAEAAVLREALEPDATSLEAPTRRADIDALWRWRDGVSLEITARRGGKLSEDIVVPVPVLAEAIDAIIEIGARHRLTACSWGHAGDGNLHATFLLDPADHAEIDRAEAAGEELFALAIRLGGSVSGEHGIGRVKRTAAARALAPEVQALNRTVKAALDPKGLLNPGVKLT